MQPQVKPGSPGIGKTRTEHVEFAPHGVGLHRSLSMQVVPLNEKPALQVQENEPVLLKHVPMPQRPGIAVHSLRSTHTPPTSVYPELQVQVKEPTEFEQLPAAAVPQRFGVRHSLTSAQPSTADTRIV